MNESGPEWLKNMEAAAEEQDTAYHIRRAAVKSKEHSQNIGCLGMSICFIGALSSAGVSILFPEYANTSLPVAGILAVATLGFAGYNLISSLKYNRVIFKADKDFVAAYEKHRQAMDKLKNWYRRN